MPEPNAFLEIVKERHDPSIKRSKPTCPFCHSKKVKRSGGSSTLVGGYRNHWWYECKCKDCGEEFTLELKEQGSRWKYIAWYTKEGKVLQGIPACFESYYYTCSKCGGTVIREERQKDGKTPLTSVGGGEYCDVPFVIKGSYADENGVWHNNYTIFFKCQDCGVEIENDGDHFELNPVRLTYEEKVEAIKKSRAAMAKWTIKEEIGTVIINDYALAKVTDAMSDSTD